MPLYGKIALNAGVEEFVEEVRHDPLTPDMIRKLANGRPALRPITAVNDPPFDPETQKLTGFAYAIFADKVDRSRSVVALTQAELDAISAGKDTDAQTTVNTPFNRALVKWLAAKFGITVVQAVGELRTLYRAEL